jgi:hypothetical protein
MHSALSWFMFGMFVWGCCIVMSAVSRRLSPEMRDGSACMPRRNRAKRAHHRRSNGEGGSEAEDPRDVEIRELKQRVATLEAIVTDPKFQWQQDFNS